MVSRPSTRGPFSLAIASIPVRRTSVSLSCVISTNPSITSGNSPTASAQCAARIRRLRTAWVISRFKRSAASGSILSSSFPTARQRVASSSVNRFQHARHAEVAQLRAGGGPHLLVRLSSRSTSNSKQFGISRVRNCVVAQA